MTTAQDGPAKLLPMPSLDGGLPPVPPPELDPYLDAAATCFARHGIGRTGVPDIARAVGTSRATVYRQVGTVDQIARLLLARELHRLLAGLSDSLASASGPDAVMALMARTIRFARGHPVLAKVLTDEPELIGPFVSRELPDLIARVSSMAVPVLEWAMDAGLVCRCDPVVLAEFLVRITLSLILAPPTGDLDGFLEFAVLPVLATGS